MTMLRPASAKWFELLTTREELAATLRCLAATGQIELQSHTDISASHLLPTLRAALDEYKRLAQPYAQHWPTAAGMPSDCVRQPDEIANGALARLRAWAVSADPLITRMQQLAYEQSQLELLRSLLSEPDIRLPDLGLFGQAGPILASRIYLLAPATGALAFPPAVLVHRIPRADLHYLIALGPKEQIAALDDTLAAVKGRRLDIPKQLPATRDAALESVTVRGEEIASELLALGPQLAKLHDEHALSEALGDLAFIEWLVAHVPELAVTEHFGWITGWTSDPSGARIEAALERAHLHRLLRFPATPPDLARPIVLRNPRWAQPFELFSRLLGVPAASEADPSPIVALIAPLMFGFMFGDVGQGAVLVATGLVLRRRYPSVALLIPGGIAAMGFGLLFGSVFAHEGSLPALWLHPIDRPLQLLGVSLAFGACVILAGLILDAVQHHWAGQARLWWSARAGLVLCYLGMIASVLDMRALWVLPVGLAWYWIGDAAAAASARMSRLGTAIGESLETLLQLFVNTISFVRVGAFALAHAGLASAINGLAAGTDSRLASWLVLALGNLAIILVEGLVVGVQTTRLVLFEFFIRFLRGSGRPFRPLPLPTAVAKHV
jgi:V/A-type H+-transporting ATPase subunit I